MLYVHIQVDLTTPHVYMLYRHNKLSKEKLTHQLVPLALLDTYIHDLCLDSHLLPFVHVCTNVHGKYPNPRKVGGIIRMYKQCVLGSFLLPQQGYTHKPEFIQTQIQRVMDCSPSETTSSIHGEESIILV